MYLMYDTIGIIYEVTTIKKRLTADLWAQVSGARANMVDPNSSQERFSYVYSCDLDTNLELKV